MNISQDLVFNGNEIVFCLVNEYATDLVRNKSVAMNETMNQLQKLMVQDHFTIEESLGTGGTYAALWLHIR